MADGRILVLSPAEETVEQNHGVLCANYMNDTLEAFHFAYDLASETSEGQTPPEVYFGTTYPIPGIEPDKRFVAELPR